MKRDYKLYKLLEKQNLTKALQKYFDAEIVLVLYKNAKKILKNYID